MLGDVKGFQVLPGSGRTRYKLLCHATPRRCGKPPLRVAKPVVFLQEGQV